MGVSEHSARYSAHGLRFILTRWCGLCRTAGARGELMQASSHAISLIQKFEGLRTTAYKPYPHEVYYTIGYGHCGPEVKADSICTEREAENLLRADLKKFETQLTKALNADEIEVTQCQYDALISFVFNLGVYTLVHGGKSQPVTATGSIWKYLKERNIPLAAASFMLYVKAGGVRSKGLVARRNAEARLFWPLFQSSEG